MKNYINRILKYGTLISSYCLIASVMLQIFARFFLDNPPTWTEEASRLFFVYTIAFAAGLAMKNDEYVYLDYFFAKMNPIVKKKLLIIIHLLTIFLFGLMSLYSLQFVKLGIPESAPSLKISMSFIFFSMLLLSISLTYFAAAALEKVIKNKV